jgi:hypothetical protein
MISRKVFFILQKMIYTYIYVSTRYWSEEVKGPWRRLEGGE